MTREERNAKIIACIRKRTKEICKTPESAMAYLVRIGIYDEDGNLSANYGGKP